MVREHGSSVREEYQVLGGLGWVGFGLWGEGGVVKVRLDEAEEGGVRGKGEEE